MPKLVYSSEKIGCGATIELDSGDVCMISVARTGVLVRAYKRGFLGALLGSFFGAVVYRETDVYRAAKTAAALSETTQPVACLDLQNPVLSAIASAVWHCPTAADVTITLNEAAQHHG